MTFKPMLLPRETPDLDTKDLAKMLDYLDGKLFANYSLTFSLSESNADAAAKVMERGGNVAVVFAINSLRRVPGTNKEQMLPLPATWSGLPVHDGDASDLRFLDPKGCIVGLRSKGKANADKSGFVQPVTV